MTMEPAMSYIGVTGLTTTDEVENVIQEFQAAGYTMDSSHIPALGFLVSFQTLNNHRPSNPSNRRYPRIGEISNLLEKVEEKALPIIHYNSRKTDTLADQVNTLFFNIYSAKLCRALQLNMVWPNPEEVKAIKKNFPQMHLVLQLSENAIINKSYKQVAEMMQRYDRSIDYIVIGPSGGHGYEFSLQRSLNIYEALKDRLSQVRVGFTGDFTGENVAPRVKKIMQATSSRDFCIIAEDGLRDKLSEDYGDDVLNQEKVRAYLQAAATVLR